MLSYMVMCGRLRQILPGTRTIPEQISENKQPYYDALEDADSKFKKGAVDVSAMENLLEQYLANQLVDVHEQATGNNVFSTKPQKEQSAIVHWFESKPVIVGTIVAITLGAAAIYFGG